MSKYDELIKAIKLYAKAEAESAKWAERRACLCHASRAKITTANAKWAIQAEARDRYFEGVQHKLKECGLMPWGKDELNGGQ
jgi:hypothetical protein